MSTGRKKPLVNSSPEKSRGRERKLQDSDAFGADASVYYEEMSWMKKEKPPGIKTRIIDNLQRSMRRLQEGTRRATEILFPPRPHHKKPRK